MHNMDKKKNKWSKSITDGKVTTETIVEEVENGFIKTITTTDLSDDKYSHECKKYISTENEFEESPLVEKLEAIMKKL